MFFYEYASKKDRKEKKNKEICERLISFIAFVDKYNVTIR